METSECEPVSVNHDLFLLFCAAALDRPSACRRRSLLLWTIQSDHRSKLAALHHNIWAGAVTAATTKVSGRCILGPLRWIGHIRPPALEINEQQIIYGECLLR